MFVAPIKFDATAPASEPRWQQLFPVGITRHRSDFGPKGITFDASMIASMVANYVAEGKPERAVGFFHKTPSHVAAPIDDKVAAGWLSELEARPDGLYGLIKWTERARKYILADELRYISPEFNLNGISKITGKPQGPTLLGAALLADPFLTELPRVAASEVPPSAEGVPTMKSVLAFLKLSESATEAEVLAAITARTEAQPLALAELNSSMLKLTEQLSSAQKENETLKASARTAEITTFVDGLVKAGKLIPAMRDGVVKMGETNGLEGIKIFELNPAVVQPNKELGVTGGTGGQDVKGDASKRLAAKEAEFLAKGANPMTAFNMARTELAADYEIVFGGAAGSSATINGVQVG